MVARCFPDWFAPLGKGVPVSDEKPLMCRLGLHHFVDFPDPNPESGALEKQGYQACTRCSKEKDSKLYLSRSSWLRGPSSRSPQTPQGRVLDRHDQPRQPGDR